MLRRSTRLQQDDSGVVAVIAAITAILLFSMGALAVDLGNAWARKRAVQTTADLAALAGAAALPGSIAQARQLAVDYVVKNIQQGGTAASCSIATATSPCWDNDGDLTNGEITFFTDRNGDGKYSASEVTTTDDGRTPTAIRVITPAHTVSFGLATAFGSSGTTVQAAATARVGSALGLGIPPFYLTASDSGNTCIKDDSNGNPSGSGVTLAVGKTPGNGTPITLVQPPLVVVASGQSITIDGSGLNQLGSADIIRLSLDSGSPVQIPKGGANGYAVSTGGTSVTFTVPAIGSATYAKVVAYAGGNLYSNEVLLPFTTVDPPSGCPGTSSNRGYIDEARFDTSGSNPTLIANIKTGLDHNVHNYNLWPTAESPQVTGASSGTTCTTPPLTSGTIFLNGNSAVYHDVNCLDMKTGSISGPSEAGFFDSSSGSSGRLYRLSSGCGGMTGTYGGHAGVDDNRLFTSALIDSQVGTTAELQTALLTGAASTGKSGWIKAAVLKCPRFAILPVLAAPYSPPNGTDHPYPIIGFKGVYFDDSSADHGFTFQGGSLRVVRGYVIDLGFLPAQVSAQEAGVIGPYLGVGPKVVQLVHDLSDPAT